MRAETLNQTSLLVTWELLETNQISQNLTFSIHLGFGIYENLAGTTTDFYYVLSNLIPNANYSIRIESVIPYSTQVISSTIYHFLELINNMSQSTQTIMTTPVNQVLQISNLLSDYLSFILIGGMLIIILLLVLVVMIVVVTCCMKERRAVEHTVSPNPHTTPIVLETPAHANKMHGQVASDMQEKGEAKIDLGMHKIRKV